MEQEEYSVEKLANESEDSRATIQRLIRLTELNNDLKSKVNNDVIGIREGVELSYIKPEEEVIVNDIIDENNLKLTTAQVQKLRSVYGTITKDTIIGTVGESKRIECLCFSGDFDYRVHVQGSGWTDWTKADGVSTLGTVGQELRIEAIQFRER